MEKLYIYLNELSRCQWKADGSLGVTYNGISEEYGVEHYNQVLFNMQSEAEIVLLRLTENEKNAIKQKVIDICNYPYDIITIENVESLKRDSVGNANKKDIRLGEYVVAMFNLQHYYRCKLLEFINNLLGESPKLREGNETISHSITNNCVDLPDNNNDIGDNGVIKGINGLASYLRCCPALAQAVVNSNVLGGAQYKVGNRWYFDAEKLRTKINDNPQLLKEVHIKRRVK